ncbi:hypothetical protein FA95DRAFT_1553314 [Auriscalpium vulgare]|uniref:Uncharacterized protein n=1 Tax=Auriscalpium vulgare TaxID=40419 RepID=A0ACB8SA23_9AGAM|nr:hypothetical protein FA95DRAFT_1553314 [Auriscalpium vulgare]
MHPSLRVAHKPLISFIGKRQWASEPQHAHPAAPAQLKEAFSDFLKKFEGSAKTTASASGGSSSKSNSGKKVFGEFWEAPERLWNSRSSYVENAEIEAVISGGASLR